MNYFHYKGLRHNGLAIKGWILAESREQAIQNLQQRGLRLYSVQAKKGMIRLLISPTELLTTFYELASLRNSGMGLDQALPLLAEAMEKNSRLHTAWSEVAAMVRSGMSLSEAMLSLPDAFPRYSAHLIRIGEANGELGSALTIAAERLQEEIKLRNDIRTALTYPLFLIIISLLVVLFLFLTVIPRFASMVNDMGGQASWSLELLIAISSFLQNYWWIWISGLISLGFYLHYLRLQGRLMIWQYAQKIVLIQPLIQAWEIVQFCGSLQRLLAQGVKLLEALNLAAETLSREDLYQALQEVKLQIQQGKSLATALKQQQLFTPLTIRMIHSGEMAANLPETLAEIHRLYRRQLDEGIKQLLSLLEPSVIFIMGIVVGSIMVSLMSAIMSVNDLPL